MNKREFTSQVKKRFEYQEARPADEGDPTNPAAPNYDFAAKFRRNREGGAAGKSLTSERAASVKDVLTMKESLVVEKDPEAVKIAFDKPPSAAYKFFVKNYFVETRNYCGVILAIVLVAFAIVLGGVTNILSLGVTEFRIDYGQLCQANFPGVCQLQINFPATIAGSTLLFFLQLDNYRQTMPGLSDSFEIKQLIGSTVRWANQPGQSVPPLQELPRQNQRAQRLPQLPQLQLLCLRQPLRPPARRLPHRPVLVPAGRRRLQHHHPHRGLRHHLPRLPLLLRPGRVGGQRRALRQLDGALTRSSPVSAGSGSSGAKSRTTSPPAATTWSSRTVGSPEYDVSAFDGQKSLHIVIQSNRFFTSGVPGVYITLYFTGALVGALTIIWASLLTEKAVRERRYAKHLRRLKGLSSELRSAAPSKVSAKST